MGLPFSLWQTKENRGVGTPAADMQAFLYDDDGNREGKEYCASPLKHRRRNTAAWSTEDFFKDTPYGKGEWQCRSGGIRQEGHGSSFSCRCASFSRTLLDALHLYVNSLWAAACWNMEVGEMAFHGNWRMGVWAMLKAWEGARSKVEIMWVGNGQIFDRGGAMVGWL